MGKPGWGHAQSPLPEHIGQWEGTGGIETSQYPEERKATATPLVAASERGSSLNLHSVIAHRRFCAGVVGLIGWDGGPITQLQNRRLAECSWKGQPQRVTAL